MLVLMCLAMLPGCQAARHRMGMLQARLYHDRLCFSGNALSLRRQTALPEQVCEGDLVGPQLGGRDPQLDQGNLKGLQEQGSSRQSAPMR